MSNKLAAKPGIELPRLSSREAHGKTFESASVNLASQIS